MCRDKNASIVCNHHKDKDVSKINIIDRSILFESNNVAFFFFLNCILV
jgi:hypothetical protein